MILKQMRFVSAQPAIEYYTWQVEVMLNNFIEMGINLNQVDIVCWKQNGVIPESWQKLANGYAARFFFYDDTRETKNYISSIRPNILKQHWNARPEIWDDVIFYHDSDIVFTKPINFDQFLLGSTWYGSDTRWYIGHDYIISKGEDILDEMCKIVDIDKQVVKDNELNSIGAQYIMKGITAEFWENVEKDCERLFKEITDINNVKKQADTSYHELQIWCADMWAVLWNGWKLGYKTECHKDLEFAWGSSPEKDWFDMNIFHNAGVTESTSGLFYKAEYMNELPYNKPLQIKEGTASYHYWQIIEDVAKKSKLL
jgi:hypothetical protein